MASSLVVGLVQLPCLRLRRAFNLPQRVDS